MTTSIVIAEPTSTTATPTPTTAGTIPGTTVTTQKPRARPPGPPGQIAPSGSPDAIHETVQRWYSLLSEGAVTGTCEPLLLAVQERRDSPSDPIAAAATAYATLYKGAAEGCLGQLAAAETDLASAAKLLVALEIDNPGNYANDLTCQPQMLLVWAYDTYLGRSIALVCPPKRER